jgi:hypothetical protein
MFLHGDPVGHVEVPLLTGTPYAPVDLRRVIIRRLTWQILRHHVVDLTATPLPREGVGIEELLETPHSTDNRGCADGAAPPVTVAVCKRDRA